MVKLKKTSWLSLIFSLFLLLLTYGAEGWMYGAWINRFLEQKTLLDSFTELTRFGIVYGVAVAGIVLLVFVFTPYSN